MRVQRADGFARCSIFWLHTHRHLQDCGGAFRDSIGDISADLMSTRPPLFIPVTNTKESEGTLQDAFVPNPACSDWEHYEWVGRLCAASILTDESLILSFPPLVWKLLGGVGVATACRDASQNGALAGGGRLCLSMPLIPGHALLCLHLRRLKLAKMIWSRQVPPWFRSMQSRCTLASIPATICRGWPPLRARARGGTCASMLPRSYHAALVIAILLRNACSWIPSSSTECAARWRCPKDKSSMCNVWADCVGSALSGQLILKVTPARSVRPLPRAGSGIRITRLCSPAERPASLCPAAPSSS